MLKVMYGYSLKGVGRPGHCGSQTFKCERLFTSLVTDVKRDTCMVQMLFRKLCQSPPYHGSYFPLALCILANNVKT